jgi:hypothetical protein
MSELVVGNQVVTLAAAMHSHIHRQSALANPLLGLAPERRRWQVLVGLGKLCRLF